MEEYAACGKLPRELFVRTPVLNATATFLVEAMGMKVVGTSPGEISVAFGPTALERPADFLPGVSSFDEDGGHFRFTLRQTPGGALPEAGDGLAYVQLALDNVRASTMMKYGGENLDAFGTIRVDAPGGFPLRIIIGDEIRERAMYAALSVSDISKSMKFYESLGMRRTKYPRARLLEGAFDPDPMKLGFFDPEPVYLNFCDDGFGILLLPTARPSLFGKFAKPVVGDIYGGIRVAAVAAAQGDAQTFTDPDGYKIDVGGARVTALREAELLTDPSTS
eukprot:CAMPEP_0184101604 /NCGR_PEP_ID=MMETSP0974-20121125/12918_1 /TAXON_ID=483370 /ORGANISM="non described non described, Strain CCMP2097" /LENGTH=277 /DNA_ID=CAMNT_0026404537 /DNA_START=1 /DNA_END=829 /DNA_ORIENTATION=+